MGFYLKIPISVLNNCMPEMSEDEFLIAELAAKAQGYMNNLVRGSQDAHKLNENRTDWRRFIHPANRGKVAMPPQYPQHYPNYPQQNQGGYPPIQAEGYGDVPTEVPANISQLPLPVDEKGNMIIPPEFNQPGQQPMGLNVSGFQIPNYGSATPVSTSGNNDEKFDLILKEIKLLKRAVNTLTNLVKKSIVVESKPETSTDTEIKSEDQS